MKHTPSVRQYAVDTEGVTSPDDVTPMRGDDRTVSKRQWTTPWHDFIDENGTLAERGRIRVVLRDDQFMIERFNAAWKPISFHRECDTVLRTLGEKSRMKTNGHLAGDYVAVRQVLEAL